MGASCRYLLTEFGHFEQDNDKTNGAEAIRWRILAVEDGKILVISEECLYTKRYHEDYKATIRFSC